MIKKIFSVILLCALFYACAGSQATPDSAQPTTPDSAKNAGPDPAVNQREQKDIQEPQSAKESQPVTPVVQYLYITKDAKMRKDPKPMSKVIATLKKGELVEKVSVSKNWIQVKSASGKTGWVLKKFVFEGK